MFPLLWQCSKAVGSEAIVTGRNIIGDMARNTDPNARIRDTVRRNGTEWAHRVIKELSGQGRKSKRATFAKRAGKSKKAKRQSLKDTTKKKRNNMKMNIFS